MRIALVGIRAPVLCFLLPCQMPRYRGRPALTWRSVWRVNRQASGFSLLLNHRTGSSPDSQRRKVWADRALDTRQICPIPSAIRLCGFDWNLFPEHLAHRVDDVVGVRVAQGGG